LRLPAPIDAERVEADITDGVLMLRLPKAESARPKQIKIQAK
jgi:HSP20 family protein